MLVAAASFGTGLFVGLLFTALKLPLPAPPVLAGVLGIVGIWAGGQLWPLLVSAIQR
jgi:XapX domain-containing protein